MGNDMIRLAVRDAAKAFGAHQLWSGVSFNLDAGEMLALRGASGSGKSTLLNCIGRLVQLDSGSIFVDGVDLTTMSGRSVRRFRQEIVGYLFQDYALINDTTVLKNLDVAARPRLFQSKPDYGTALSKVGLSGREKSKIYELSGGEQQRVALARLLLRPTRMILADEPTAALDQSNAAIVLDLLRQLADRGSAVVIATHHDSVASLCDHEMRVEQGGLVPIR